MSWSKSPRQQTHSDVKLVTPEKMAWPSHNALLGMGYFAQFMLVVSDKTYTWNARLGRLLITKVSFITNDPRDNLYNISHWKQCIVGRLRYLLCSHLSFLCPSNNWRPLESQSYQLGEEKPKPPWNGRGVNNNNNDVTKWMF